MLKHSIIMGSYTKRGQCDICCVKCENAIEHGVLTQNHHNSREPYKTAAKCSFCQVNLCVVGRKIWGGKSCYDWFHEKTAKEAFTHPFTYICAAAEDVKDETHPDVIAKTPLEHERVVRRMQHNARQSKDNAAEPSSSSAPRQPDPDPAIRKLEFHSSLGRKSKRARNGK